MPQPKPAVQNLALQICDQCNARRVKCNRVLPVCKHCERRSELCTYFRVTRKLPRMAAHPEFYQLSQVFHASGASHLPRSNKPKGFRIRQYLPPATRVHNHRSDLAIRIVHEWPFQGWVSFLMVAFNFPVLENKITPESNMFLTVFTAITSGSRKSTPVLSPPCANPFGPNSHYIAPYLKQATQAYFKYINPFLPLFTQNTFGTRQRSRLLMLTIWTSGLIFLPQNNVVKTISEELSGRLFAGLKKNYKQVSFEMLQILLVTLHGLHHLRWALNSAWMCCSLTLNLSHALGLHTKAKVSCPVLAMERSMAYNNLLYFSSVRSWVMDAGCNFTLAPDPENVDLSTQYPINLDPLIGNRGNMGQTDTVLINVHCFCALVVSDCQRHIAHALYELRKLRFYVLNSSGTGKDVLRRLVPLQNLLREQYMKYMRRLHESKAVIVSNFDDQRATNLCEPVELSLSLLNLHYQSFFKDTVALTVHLHPNLNLPPSRQPLQDCYPSQMESALDASARILNIDRKLGKEPYSGHRITTLAKAIIFLIQHHHRSDRSILFLEAAKDGRSMLVNLSSVTSFKANCFFTLALVDQFLSHIKSDFVPKNSSKLIRN